MTRRWTPVRLTLAGGLLAAGLLSCAGKTSQPLFPQWLEQQSRVEERLASTCAKIKTASPARHSKQIVALQLRQLEALTALLATTGPKEVRDACKGVPETIDAQMKQLNFPSRKKLVAAGGSAHECAKKVSEVLKRRGRDTSRSQENIGGIIHMIGATGGNEPEALLTTAAELSFARATVFALIEVAEWSDKILDNVASSFGKLKPIAGMVLRKVAADLLAVGVDQFMQTMEKDRGQSSITLTERACEASGELSVRSEIARAVLARIILRFDSESMDATLGVTQACHALGEKKCQNIQEMLLVEGDGNLLQPGQSGANGMPVTPKPHTEKERQEHRKNLVNSLQAQAPATPPLSPSDLNPLVRLADTCSELHPEVDSRACSADRLAWIISYYGRFIGRLPPGDPIPMEQLQASLYRIEANILNKLDLQGESTRKRFDQRFDHFLRCRAAHERRDVLAAAVGLRPLMPCTGAMQPDKVLDSKSLTSLSATRAMICSEQNFFFDMKTLFNSGVFIPSSEGKKQLRELGLLLMGLDAKMRVVEVLGVADQVPISPQTCQAIVSASKQATLPQSPKFSCTEPELTKRSRELNQQLALLRSQSVCEALGIGDSCKPAGEQLDVREVRLRFMSSDLSFNGDCTDLP